MKDGIRVFLPEELEKIVKQEADAEHVSPGEYISMVVKDGLSGKTLNEDFEETQSQGKDRSKEVNIHLYGEDADQIKIKAANLGLTPTSYVRRLAYTKEYAMIQVPTDDLREFIDNFINLEKAVVAAVGYIKRGDGEVFAQDIELLKDYMGEITALFKEQVKVSYATRTKVQQKMMKQIRDQVKKTKE